jgi:hypothetical protein
MNPQRFRKVRQELVVLIHTSNCVKCYLCRGTSDVDPKEDSTHVSPPPPPRLQCSAACNAISTSPSAPTASAASNGSPRACVCRRCSNSYAYLPRNCLQHNGRRAYARSNPLCSLRRRCRSGHAGARVAEERLPRGAGRRRKHAELRRRTEEVAGTHGGLIKKIRDMKESCGLKVLLRRRRASRLDIRASFLRALRMAAEQRSMEALKQLKKCVVCVDTVLSRYNIDSGQMLIRVIPSCSAK